MEVNTNLRRIDWESLWVNTELYNITVLTPSLQGPVVRDCAEGVNNNSGAYYSPSSINHRFSVGAREEGVSGADIRMNGLMYEGMMEGVG